MVFPWFSHGFPMVSLDVPIIFQSDTYHLITTETWMQRRETAEGAHANRGLTLEAKRDEASMP